MTILYCKFEPVGLEKNLSWNHKFLRHLHINNKWQHEIGQSPLKSKTRERIPRRSPYGFQISHGIVFIFKGTHFIRGITGCFIDKIKFEDPWGSVTKAKGEGVSASRQKAEVTKHYTFQSLALFPEDKTELGLSTTRYCEKLLIKTESLTLNPNKTQLGGLTGKVCMHMYLVIPWQWGLLVWRTLASVTHPFLTSQYTYGHLQ